LRAVTGATAAAILELDQKTFDNLLLRLGDLALPPGRQGVERRIPVTLLEELLLTRDLHQALGIPTRDAFLVSRQLLGRQDPHRGGVSPEADFLGSLHAGAFVHIAADLQQLREHLNQRLASAVETVVRRPRGRPAKSVAPPLLGDA